MNEHLKTKDSIEEVIKGANILGDIVLQTLGPKGKNILIEKSTGPEIINDGVTIGKHVFLDDRLQNMGAMMMKQISKNTDDNVSDGTTTATCLGLAILNMGYESIKNNPNLNTINLKKWLHYWKDEVIKILEEKAIDVNDENLFHVCMISSNNDEVLAKLIMDAYKEVGPEGYITVAHPISVVPSFKATKGMIYDKGWLSKMFKNNNKEKAFVAEKAKVVYVEGELRDQLHLISILEKGLDDGKNSPIIVVADKFTEDIVALALQNKFAGIDLCLVNAPGLVEEQMDYMNDMIAYTGGYIFNQKASRTLYEITDEDFGKVDYVKVTDKQFLFKVENPDSVKIEERILELRAKIDETKEKMFQNLYKVRLAKLTSGIAVIYPGGQSDIEIEDNIQRAKDAIGSLKAALEKGVLPGGGIALYRTASILNEAVSNVTAVEKESPIAFHIIFKSLFKPLQTILDNCGYEYEEKAKIINEISYEDFWIGYNARTEKIENMLESGVIDPLKVQISALENAVSVSTAILNMGGSICLRQIDFEQGKTPLMELR